MNLYCSDQKTFTKKGRNNWDVTFNTRFVIIKDNYDKYKIIESVRRKNKYISVEDNKDIINDIVGICSNIEDAEDVVKNLEGVL